MSAKMTFLEELRDIQNYILGKSQELNSSYVIEWKFLNHVSLDGLV